jgi:hypothetical protein
MRASYSSPSYSLLARMGPRPSAASFPSLTTLVLEPSAYSIPTATAAWDNRSVEVCSGGPEVWAHRKRALPRITPNAFAPRAQLDPSRRTSPRNAAFVIFRERRVHHILRNLGPVEREFKEAQSADISRGPSVLFLRDGKLTAQIARRQPARVSSQSALPSIHRGRSTSPTTASNRC